MPLDRQTTLTADSTTGNWTGTIVDPFVDINVLRELTINTFVEDGLMETNVDPLIQGVQKKISDGVEVSRDEMKKYLLTIKKKSHLGRSERRTLHNPKDSDGKTTESICVDDLVNV